MHDPVKNAAETITRMKKLNRAKDEIYPQLAKLSDLALEIRGVSMVASAKHGVHPDDLWKWILKQISE